MTNLTTRSWAASAAVLFLFSGCKESESTKKNSGDALGLGTKKKLRISGNLSRKQQDTERVWRRFGLIESRETNLTKRALVERLEGLRKQRYSAAGSREFETAIGQLAELDPSLTLSFFPVSEIRRGEPGFKLAASIIAEIEPSLLKDWLQGELASGPTDVRADCLMTAMEALGRVDPQSALEFYLKSDWKGAESSDALNTIFTQYGAVDPLGGLAMAESKLKGNQIDEARYRLALSSGQSDPSASMDIALKISDKTLRGLAIQGNLSRLFDSAPAEALDKMRSLKSSDLQEVLSSGTGINLDGSILQKIAKDNPAALVQTISSLSFSSSNESLFRSIVDELGKSSPAESMKVIESLPEGAAKRSMESVYYGRIAHENFDAACEQAAKISDAKSRVSAYDGIGKAAGEKGLEAVMGISKDLSETDQISFLSTSLPQVLNSDPKQFSEALNAGRLSIPEPLQSKLYFDLGQRLDGVDSGYAQKWFDGLSASQKSEAFKGIAKSSISRDPIEFSQKLMNMPKDSAWRSGVEMLIDTLRTTDPESANLWKQHLSEAAPNR